VAFRRRRTGANEDERQKKEKTRRETTPIKVWVTPAEEAAITVKADAYSLSASTYLRELALLGSRATIFELEGLGSDKRKYLKWLLVQSVSPKTKIESVITDDAVAMLSEKLSTPLQFEYYLTRALEEA